MCHSEPVKRKERSDYYNTAELVRQRQWRQIQEAGDTMSSPGQLQRATRELNTAMSLTIKDLGLQR